MAVVHCDVVHLLGARHVDDRGSALVADACHQRGDGSVQLVLQQGFGEVAGRHFYALGSWFA
ncbi:hypothetical protein D3C77_622780 [compost metagenome]